VKEPKGTTIHTNSKIISADLASKEINITTHLQQSAATNSKGTFVDDNKSLRRSVRLNNICSSDDISTCDQDMLEKSMKRTTWKNLDGPAPQQPSPAPKLVAWNHLLPRIANITLT
jgi:hypothetical protein